MKNLVRAEHNNYVCIFESIKIHNLRIGISSKDIFDDNNGLLNHIVDFDLNQLKQYCNAPLSCSF